MIPAEIIRNHGSSIVVHNFDTLVNQFDAFHLIHSAVGLLDPENHLIFENNTFKELNHELRDSPEYFASHQSLLECPTLITSVNEAFSSKEPTILKHRFYYTSTIHVDLSLCFTPILTNKDNTVHGLLCTIGEESIGFETKHLAKLQDKLSRLKKRIKHLDKEKMHNDHLVKVLFNEAPTAMLLLNSERHILQANLNAMKLFGVSAKILIGKSCTTILDCSQTCNCCPLMDNQNIKSDEINGIGRDGKAIPLLRSAVKFRDVNETILIEAFMDLRETKQAQSESRAKSAFLANMSHEIRTPLTAIIGYAETLLDRNESMSDRIKSTNTIIRSSRHLQQLINKILDLSKIEAEKMDVEKIEVSIFGLLSEVQSIALSQAQSKRLDFSIDYDFPLPEKIINDPVRMRQILINLCSNAIKFTQQGSVRVHVGYSQKDNKMVFKVIDTGIGMTSEQRSKIFYAFTQADAFTTRKYGGTGLGLHLSKQLAELLGGNLVVESKPGQGSCFTFTADSGKEDNLSFANSLPEKSQHIHEFTAFPDREIVSGKVLLAEDNIDNQQLMSLYLRKAGAEVTIAENGKVAVDLAQSNNFDLILMDMQMPVMNGIEASEKLRTSGYSGAIVALTANTMQEYIDQYYKVGCSGFLAKPIDRERFYNVLTKHLPPADAAGEPMEPLRSILLDEDGDFSELVEEYIQGFPQMLAQLRKLFEKKDWESLKRQAHDLKGTSGNYGFMEVMERSLKLQFEIEKMDSHGVSLLLDELNILYQRMLL